VPPLSWYSRHSLIPLLREATEDCSPQILIGASRERPALLDSEGELDLLLATSYPVTLKMLRFCNRKMLQSGTELESNGGEESETRSSSLGTMACGADGDGGGSERRGAPARRGSQHGATADAPLPGGRHRGAVQSAPGSPASHRPGSQGAGWVSGQRGLGKRRSGPIAAVPWKPGCHRTGWRPRTGNGKELRQRPELLVSARGRTTVVGP